MFWVNIVVVGLTVGSIYALFGLGITLVYKATRVPNFAHGAIGMVGAFVFFRTWNHARPDIRIKAVHLAVPFVRAWHWNFVPPALPFAASLLLALVCTAVVGLGVSRLMRHLEGAPTILLIVATLGLVAVITGLLSDLFSPNSEIVPPVIPEGYHHWGGVNVANDSLAYAAIALLLAVGFTLFFKRTNLGVALRATADSREVARLLGINARLVSDFAWIAGSTLACIAAILLTPRNQLDQVFLFLFTVPGFAAALFGGFTSLGGTFVGGLVLGITESLVIGAHWPDALQPIFTKAGTPQFVAFVVIIVVLMTRPRFIFKGVRVEEESGVGVGRRAGMLGPEDQLRRALDRIGALPVLLRDWRLGRWLIGGLVVVALLAVPLFAVSYWSTVLAQGVVSALVALSLVVLTGWTGQINLAPLTFAGAGAWGAAILGGSLHLPFWLTIPLAGLVGVPIALVIGIPALRLRGFFLAIATVAFGLAGEAWLFTLPQITVRNKVPRGILTETLSQPTYLVALLFAALLFVGVVNLSRTRVARAWHAIRDGETTATAMGIDPVRYKLLAFVLSGFIAGIAGGLFGYVNRILYAPSFALGLGFNYVLFALLAGVGEIFGAFLVGTFIVLPSLFAAPASGVNQFPTYILPGILAILTVIQYPNGLAAFYRRVVRRFDASERVAWASVEVEGSASAAAIAATSTEIDVARVAEEVAAGV